MSRILVSVGSLVLSILAVAWAAASVALSWHTHDWVWFQRSGSVVALIGAILAGRAILRLGRKGATPPPAFEVGKIIGSTFSKEKGVRLSLQRDPQVLRRQLESGRDATATVMGFGLGAVGTLIWGYGDLVHLLVP